MIHEEQISSIWQKLTTAQKQIAYDFLQDLVSKESKQKADGKAILLRTPVWDEESIQQIEDVRKHINSWNPVKYS